MGMYAVVHSNLPADQHIIQSLWSMSRIRQILFRVKMFQINHQ